jgi:hypothetical protein
MSLQYYFFLELCRRLSPFRANYKRKGERHEDEGKGKNPRLRQKFSPPSPPYPLFSNREVNYRVNWKKLLTIMIRCISMQDFSAAKK